jgi:hypothetical protein
MPLQVFQRFTMIVLMKAVLLSCCISILFVQAQDANRSPTPKTQLEAFSAKSGSVVIKGYSNGGSVEGFSGRVEITLMEFTDASLGKKQQGIVVEVTSSGSSSRKDRSYIDLDEIDGLIKGIEYIIKIDDSETKLPNWEATYSTKGDLKVTTYNDGRKITAAISSGTYSPVRAYMNIEKLKEFREALARGIQNLNEIK